jgi:hypothetical protein
MKNKKPKFDIGKPIIKFTCDWAVYPVRSDSSMCYTTSKERAELIADALNKYKGWKKWWKK